MKHSFKSKLVFALIAIIIASVMFLVGCLDDTTDSLKTQADDSVSARTESMKKAEALYPVPINKNFPIREVLVDYTKRQDLTNHPWYTYVFSDTGAITHYFVSTTLPVSTNAFLGSTESVWSGYNGASQVLTAPSLDGVYYGGSGSVSAASGWIFVDANTNALGVIYGCKIMTFDAPLQLETEPQLITISSQE